MVIITIFIQVIKEQMATNIEGNITPKKLHPRNSNLSVCRLCPEETEKSHLIRVFAKTGSQKNLQDIITKTCGIKVLEQDMLSTTICRKCQRFILKMKDFRDLCQKNQITLRQQFSVKRMALSPKVHQSKQKKLSNNENIPPEPFLHSPKKKLIYSNKSLNTEIFINTEKQDFNLTKFVSVLHVQPSNSKNKMAVTEESTNVTTEHKSVYNKNNKIFLKSSLSIEENSILQKTISYNEPNEIAKTVLKIPKTSLATRKLIAEEMSVSCQSLCKRKGKKSVLLDTTYKGLSEFAIEKIWEEIKDNHPFLLDIFNSISGKNIDFDDTAAELKIKYCFVYGILVNCRWHELSLLQRINTILLIEGGCSKQVHTLGFI